MTTGSTLTAYQLGELLRKVAPHIGRHSGYGALQGVRLDADGHHLHAVATDRYTMAVARARLRNNDSPWALTVSTRDLPALTGWLELDGEENVHLSPGTYDVTLTSDRRKLTIPAFSGEFPDWRGIFRTAMEHEAGETPYSGFTSDFLKRWETAGHEVHTWQPGPSKPLIVISHEFLGMQMPTRVKGEPGIAVDHAAWAGSLGDGNKVEQVDTFHHHEHEELAERESFVADAAADLLRQVLRSTSDLFELATRDSGALAAYSLAGGRAWMAYRLLKALEKADPDLLRTTLADVDEQLESGEIGEWAWDEAAAAGHDPQQWHDDYEAHLKALAAKKADTAA